MKVESPMTATQFLIYSLPLAFSIPWQGTDVLLPYRSWCPQHSVEQLLPECSIRYHRLHESSSSSEQSKRFCADIPDRGSADLPEPVPVLAASISSPSTRLPDHVGTVFTLQSKYIFSEHGIPQDLICSSNTGSSSSNM